ncbi:sugar-binding domain-containing protein [uncultured Bacteroides sp.]|uniref:glycoside hydrolase family 2 protein n=1 Tax=uncultured Bacteroides sp. TaxID=162156 RepID=UPI002AA67F5B|nr:sugar-binding domain-containing protein [uncultured Bacteroides sp.]
MRKNAIVFATILLCMAKGYATDKVNYHYLFNPMQGLVNSEERGFREEICMNGTWNFMPVYNVKAADFKRPSSFHWEVVPIKIPSPWNVNAFTDGTGGDFVAYPSYPKKWEEARIGWMRKVVNIPSDWSGKQMILHFEAVMGKTQVYVNGEEVGTNFELFLPFEFDVTSYLRPGQRNEILVGVAKASLFDDQGKYGRRTYVGGSMWGIDMAGIWQDVSLFAYPPVYVSGMFVQPDVKNKQLIIELDIRNATSQKKTVDVNADIRKWYNTAGRSVNELPVQRGELAAQSALKFKTLKKVELLANAVTKIRLEAKGVEGLDYWTPEMPNLYGAVVRLTADKQIIDKKYERFGWRQFRIEGNRLLLNERPIFLKGDSWHFMGVPQMTRRYAWAWFNMLKDANANAVRLHAEPFPRFYLDVADEMGICVLDETGIWSSDGGPKIDSEDYWNSCAEHLRRLINRDKNHAAVFGWSVCNETVPVVLHVFKAPESLVQKQIQEINHWVRIVSEMDPTRTWISGDGETDRPTDLPTIVGHYGGTDGMKHWASQGKPWGIGEQSMAYYGTPKQASVYNGNRAYESMKGRMEAIALESYDLIKTQRENNASYSSIFNLVWYGLQPLPLGLSDTSRKSGLEDGVFFDFKESAHGMQPERLGPYTTTLNPGYDASLPLYRTWPLFDAVRCANATPIAPYKGKKSVQEIAPFEQVIPADGVRVFATGSALKEGLENLGIKVVTDEGVTSQSLLIIDGKNFPDGDKKQLAIIKKGIVMGARIVVLNLTKESLAEVNELLPYPVVLDDRKATSFIVAKNALALQGLTNADFYFSELLPRGKTAMYYGMKGDFISKAHILLRACNTEWQCWNNRPETSKTGYVFRSEHEAKGSDVVLASLHDGKAEFILSTLDLSDIRQETQSVLSRFLINIGAVVSNNNLTSMQALGGNAVLHRALVCGPMTNVTQTDLSTIHPKLNMQFGNGVWKVQTANPNDLFSFQFSSSGNKVVCMSYWIYSPRSLSNLLAEPDMPNLDMFVRTKGHLTLWLNGQQVTSREISTGNNETKISNLILDKGWNHLTMKLEDNSNLLKMNVRFESSDSEYLKKLLSSVVR